jgi:hypothetical protein
METETMVIKPPPPIPCTALADISMPMLYDSAATRDPTKKTTLAIRRMGLRPKISDILAQIGVELAAPSRYAEPTHV